MYFEALSTLVLKNDVKVSFTTSIFGRTDVECADDIGFGQNRCRKCLYNIGFSKTDVVRELSTLVLDQPMLFFVKKT